jgi:MFS family permease
MLERLERQTRLTANQWNILGAAAGAWLAPVIGWRGLFLVGLAPALLVVMIRAWIPESPHWLMRMGRHQDARRSLAWALQCRPGLDGRARRAAPDIIAIK